MESYLIGTLSVIFQSLYLLTVQRFSEQKSSSDVLYINSLLSFPMVLILMILFSNEIPSVLSYTGYKTFSFWLYFLASTFGGGLLNGATFWCTKKNSALTTRYLHKFFLFLIKSNDIFFTLVLLVYLKVFYKSSLVYLYLIVYQ